MPICPGCERKVPYDRLDLHQRYCGDIRSDVGAGTVPLERLDRRLSSLESRLDAQLGDIEADLERQLSKIEEARRNAEPTGRTE